MNYKTRMLVAVGAAVTANCQPCLQSAAKVARDAGVEDKEVREAIAIAKLVRRGAIGNMDEFASNLTGDQAGAGEAQDQGCGCGQEGSASGASSCDTSNGVRTGRH